MINKNRLIQTFLDLIKIDSPSGKEKEISLYLAKKIKELSGDVEFDSYGNLIAKFKGTGKPIMLNSHMDTVEPGRAIVPHITDNKITSDGRTILGGDAKSGIGIILETLTSISEDGKRTFPIDVVFTVEEESGLFGAVKLDYTMLDAKHGITFDGHGAVENITIGAPGYIRVDAVIKGKGAHSGYEPEKGLSAIKIAAEIIMQLEERRIDHETTANIGLIKGGSVRNAVPEFVHLKGEIRSRDIQKLEKYSKHFEKVFRDANEKYPLSTINLTLFKEFDPYNLLEDDNIIKLAKNSLSEIGLIPKLISSGGGTDVNIFHKKGIEAVSVGAGYYNAHTTREYVVISELINGARFCEEIVLVK